MTVKRSDLLKIMAQMNNNDELIHEQLSALEQRLLMMEVSHQSLLRRYNELEVRWPTLIPRNLRPKAKK